MRRSTLTRVILPASILFTLLPRGASAQSTIAGLVTDSTGALLPGVTVEASSSALIEKVRTVVTDSQGRYSIVDVRPGIFIVTFTLPGFSTVRREGIEVASNVNVPVNAELKVGALEESVTVSGATPTVDVQVASRTQVLTRDVLDALPTARTYGSAGAIIPGLKLTRPDMGGTEAVQQSYVTAHGMTTKDNAMQVDGMDVRPNNEVGNQQYPNFGMMQEVTYQTSALSAETSPGGVRINMIPREGGNLFKGEVYFSGSDRPWQANNITPELRSRGVPTPTAIEYMYDLNPAVGGPLQRNTLWFVAPTGALH
jgi:hypothetical protein